MEKLLNEKELIEYLESHLTWCNKEGCYVCRKNREAIKMVNQLQKENRTFKRHLNTTKGTK
ncbi:MAG: hypothetical protein PHW73_01855 [Atribacterota bacterium]|nr:hypothetical protein [Atribacterota bacterium]